MRWLLFGWVFSQRSLSGIEGVKKSTQPHMSIELVTRVGLKLLMADIFKNFESLNLLLTVNVLENKAAFFFSFFKEKNKVLKN